MKRIGILTAGGDTPALNATIAGAVERASQLRIEVFGLIKGYGGLLNPEVPHVHLNPLFQTIPELDAARGGTILGASRDYVASDDRETIERVVGRLNRLGIEGLVCIGGDGTLNGMQAFCDYLPAVLAPKTIDNDLGLNYPDEPTEFIREPDESSKKGYRYEKRPGRPFELEEMVNFATPGYATSVFVSAQNIQRIRTTAESHRRIAITEVMGRDSGMIALGTAFGQPDMILVPEVPVDPEAVVNRLLEILDRQKHAVLVVSEGIKDAQGHSFGAVRQATCNTPEPPRPSSRSSSSTWATPSSPASVGTRAPTRRFSAGRSATPSEEDGRSASTASRPLSWGARRWISSPRGDITTWPRFSIAREAMFTKGSTPRASGTVGG
jgi:6-phosphofructokinase 1